MVDVLPQRLFLTAQRGVELRHLFGRREGSDPAGPRVALGQAAQDAELGGA
eukprot:CAMPEP_0183578650 /NCGR_PEP_ID=MMETSP0371-20130417/142261_1 /TAXON_ID=268820 /ORGANISM="Peridinium aciculiferum, Strain PAER-2" /LENGTH=50 /DNA_ID=CAMNT_0025789097 /DNA_START=34 /DNA_END=182 /DNA_ORIENTATION=+